MICWRGAAEVAVTFHQGVSTTPPHQAAGDCVCLVSGYFFVTCFLYCLLYHHIASKRYALFHQNTHTYTLGFCVSLGAQGQT